jgi:ribosomal protein S17E
MGRIKTQLIKRSTIKLLEAKRSSFTKNFDKKMRNVIAGYATRLVKNEKEL